MTDDPQYSARVQELFDTAPGSGRPTSGDGWAQGEASDPLTATCVRWHLRARRGRVVDARYEVRGCPHTIAAAALVAERLAGQSVGDLAVDVGGVARDLAVPPEKLGRLFVIEDAVRRAALQLCGAGA